MEGLAAIVSGGQDASSASKREARGRADAGNAIGEQAAQARGMPQRRTTRAGWRQEPEAGVSKAACVEMHAAGLVGFEFDPSDRPRTEGLTRKLGAASALRHAAHDALSARRSTPARSALSLSNGTVQTCATA